MTRWLSCYYCHEDCLPGEIEAHEAACARRPRTDEIDDEHTYTVTIHPTRPDLVRVTYSHSHRSSRIDLPKRDLPDLIELLTHYMLNA